MKIENTDKFLLYYPPVLYGLAFLYVFVTSRFNQDNWLRTDADLFSFLTFTLLGNFAHNFLSFWQLVRIDEFKNWAAEYRFYKFNIWQIIFVIFTFFLLISIYILPSGFNLMYKNLSIYSIEGVAFVILLAINTYHNLGQTKGIGISLTHRLAIDVSTMDKNKITQKEKTFFNLLMLDWCIFVLYTIFLKDFYYTQYLYLRSILSIYLFFNLYRSYKDLPSELRRLKFLYQFRNLYRVFLGFHPAVVYFAFAIHGMDAITVYWRAILNTNSTTSKFKLKIEYVFIFFILGLSSYILKTSDLNSSLLYKFVSATLLTHYVIEGFMYRMANRTTKQYISKLL